MNYRHTLLKKARKTKEDKMPNTDSFMQQMGQAAGGGIIGIGMQGLGNQLQLKQQKKLMEAQAGQQKGLMDYQNMKQMEMWRNTNYPAQLEMMKKAGLSPGLMYGKGGGGGVTTGNATGSVTGAQAPSGGHEIPTMIGLGMQSALQEAQIENIKANTEKTKAETGNVPLTGENIQASTASLTQGIQNQKAVEILTKAQTTIANLEAQLKGATIDDMEDIARWTAEKAKSEMEMAEREAYIQKATMNTKIDIARAELVNIYVKNVLTSAQTDNTRQDTALKGAQIDKISQEITNMITEMQQKWMGLSMEERRTQMTERLIKFNTAISQRTYDNIIKGVNTISGVLKPGTTVQHTGDKNTSVFNY